MGRNDPMLTSLSNNRTSPKWTFGGRHGSACRPGTPGPGSYASRRESQGSGCPAWGFGTSTREARAASAPGPGQYDSVGRSRRAAPTYGFGSAPRNCRIPGKQTPGPGAYTPDFNKTGHDAPRYTATPRRSSGAGRSLSRPSTPGPGAYHPSRRDFPKSSPEWGFGTAERGKTDFGLHPGPGAYTEPSMVGDGPKYTIRGKPDPIAWAGTDQPGPGQYGGCYTQFGY